MNVLDFQLVSAYYSFSLLGMDIRNMYFLEKIEKDKHEMEKYTDSHLGHKKHIL